MLVTLLVRHDEGHIPDLIQYCHTQAHRCIRLTHN